MDALIPNPREILSRARADLRLGLPVALRDGDRLALIVAAETVPQDRLTALTETGDAVLALTHWRAETLKIRVYDTDLARLVLTRGLKKRDLAGLIDPVADLDTPLKGPFVALRDGDATFARAGLRLAKQARVLPAVIIKTLSAAPQGVTVLESEQIAEAAPSHLVDVVSARLPISATTETRLHVFRPDDGGEEHYAVEVGRIDPARPVLTRLHSACFTGDVLGSLKCDCGPQLNAALTQMAAGGGGVLLYLNQEGRGIGLANKMRAYALQDQGFDTVEANHRLGFDDDERDFGIGAAMLSDLGVGAVRLLTNNPRKVERLQREGITVAERVPLWVGATPQNAGYLSIKASKSGHLK